MFLTRKWLLPLSAFVVLLSSCNGPAPDKSEPVEGASRQEAVLTDGHPAWILQGNIYEVNVRQYTPEGTFRAFEKHLDRLKEMGVQTLWFMPIQPISVVGRKGQLGSYYAVADYTAVNPEFGTLNDWKQLVDSAHAMGFKVVLDWVPNHTGADHHWLQKFPDFYVRDAATGQVKWPHDWDDTRELNYDNAAMRDSMIACMKFWIMESGIDGYRCDVASEVPKDFWQKAIPEFRKIKPDFFMLAEANDAWLHEAGFDETYAWNEFAMMKKIAAGKRNASAFDSCLSILDSTYPKNTLRLYFTSNHDENSWNKADFGTMPGPIHAPFAILTQTLPRSVPLIYSGQEEPFLDSVRFFYKDTILFQKFGRSTYYKTLLQLRKEHPALAANASFSKVIAGDPKQVYAYTRESGNDRILVILNLSAREATIQLRDRALAGQPLNLFLGRSENPAGKPWKMEPWGYAVYVYTAP